MARWRAVLDGKVRTFENYEVSAHETEADARAAVLARGARLVAEKMIGAIYYNDQTGESFRVSSRAWAAGFVVWGVREVGA